MAATTDFEGNHLSLSLNDIVDDQKLIRKNVNGQEMILYASVQSDNHQNIRASKQHNLSFFPTVLAFISTIVGGGVVGIPYSFYYCGIPMAIVLNIIIALLTIYSCYLYLLAKDMTDGNS